MHIVTVIDRSGSMIDLMKDVIGGYNEALKQHKQLEGKVKITTVLFDDLYKVFEEKVPAQEAKELTPDRCFARGSTALLDAVGKTIGLLGKKKKVIFFINTDGYENTSREFTHTQIKALVEEKTAAGWEFHFLGAGLDNFTDATRMGIGSVFSYTGTSAGIMDSYGQTVTLSTSYFSNTKKADDPV